jgi:hypothetical protein
MTGASHLPDLGGITGQAPAEILNRQQIRHDARLDRYASMCRDCCRIKRRGALAAVVRHGLGFRLLKRLSVSPNVGLLLPHDLQRLVKTVSSTILRA